MKNSTKLFQGIVILIIFCVNANAQTNVSGGIYTNTTWTLANSPYIVVDTVVVFPGVTLTIEPGVVVKFDDNKRLEVRYSNLIANGNPTDSITFTSSSATPTAGIYSGIYLLASLNVNFNYCKFQYATGGFSGFSGNGVTLNCSNSSFTNNLYGVNNISNGRLTFDFCVFNYNYVGLSHSANFFLNISNSVFNNNAYGIKHNGYDIRTTITSCFFTENTTSGLLIDANCTILNCMIQNNNNGIEVVGNNDSIRQNTIEHNNIGILNDGFNILIECNKICNDTIYDLKNISTNNSIAANNYWCTSDSSIVATHVYDGYDDFTVGLVDFMPIDTVQCYLTGCLLSVSASVINATCDTCHNGNATAIVSSGFSPYTYTWNTSPIQTTQTATGLASGTYTICVTDANGCTACNSVFIDSTNCTGFAINANATNATCITCNDGFAWGSVTGGTAPYYYTWYTTPIQTADTATGLLQGNYSVCVTDFYGCVACDSVTVSIGNCSAHFNLYPDTIAHQYYAVNMASGIPPLAYSWNWGDGSPYDTVPYPNHTYASAGFYTICLTITDSAGCTNTYCNSFYLQRTTNTMVFVNVIPESTTGINEGISNTSLLIFPNPFSEKINFTIKNNKELSEIILYDIASRKLLQQKFTNSVSINTSQLAKGIYIYEVRNKNGAIKKGKVVKE